MGFIGDFSKSMTSTKTKQNNINTLKKELKGGLRTNKYLIEMSFAGVDGKKVDILSKEITFPERNISTSYIWHKGRKYQVRGETDFSGTLDITFLDDDKMTLRKSFDTWMKKVDDSKPKSGSIFGEGFDNAMGLLNSAANVASSVKNIYDNPAKILGDYAKGLMDDGQAQAVAAYQTEFNIWQLSSDNKKVYGYTLQNVFPKSMGPVRFSDESQNELTSFTVSFAYSEFLEMQGSVLEQIGMSALGSDGANGVNTLKSVFS